MDDEEETYRLWKIRKTIMQVIYVHVLRPASLACYKCVLLKTRVCSISCQNRQRVFFQLALLIFIKLFTISESERK